VTKRFRYQRKAKMLTVRGRKEENSVIHGKLVFSSTSIGHLVMLEVATYITFQDIRGSSVILGRQGSHGAPAIFPITHVSDKKIGVREISISLSLGGCHLVMVVLIHQLVFLLLLLFLLGNVIVFVIGPIGFDHAAVTMASKAIVLHQPPLPAGIILVYGKIAQADFPALRNIMNNANDDVGVVVVVGGGVDVIETAGIRKAVVVEERGIRVDTISSDGTLAIVTGGERLHHPKGIELVLGQQCGREFHRESLERRMRRAEGGDEGMKELRSGGIKGVRRALKGEQNLELRREETGKKVGGHQKTGLDLEFHGLLKHERGAISETREGLAYPWRVA
jgi:hypothetical protein